MLITDMKQPIVPGISHSLKFLTVLPHVFLGSDLPLKAVFQVIRKNFLAHNLAHYKLRN